MSQQIHQPEYGGRRASRYGRQRGGEYVGRTTRGRTGGIGERTSRGESSSRGERATGSRGERTVRGGRGTRAGMMDFESGLTSDMRLALHDFVKAATVSEWCADLCLDHGQEMSECVRLCEDVADLATLNVKFISRDSPFGIEIAKTFAYAAEEAAEECSRHPHDHCQEAARVLDRAVDSTWKLVDTFEGGY